jgi:hypothetical protein
MPRLALLALALLAAPAQPGRFTAGRAGRSVDRPGQGAPSALPAAAEALAREVGPPAEERRALLLAVDARAPALRSALETALDAALSARGYAVTPHRSGADPEASARAARQDWLLRVRAGLVPGRRELGLVGELIPAWPSFFLQRHPEARAIPPRIVQARATADPETLLLAREPAPAGAPFATVRRLGRLPAKVLALAIGEPGEPGHVAIVAATAEAIHVLSASGERIATWAAAPAPLAPVRDPTAALAVGDFGTGRIAAFRAGAAHGEVLALRGDRLEAAGTLDAPPLCAGEPGPIFGAFEPGTGVFQRLLSRPGAAAAAHGTLYGVACAPRRGRIAFAALGTDLRVELLGPDLTPIAPSEPAARVAPLTGSGFALADLDADGTPELVASSPDPAAPERIRVLAPLADAPVVLASEPIAGAILAGAAGDLTGDGVDDAVLGAVVTGDDGSISTELLLVTSDPRESP